MPIKSCRGCLCNRFNSDIPGTVRVKATETVYDRFLQGKVLIPMDTTFLGRQEGQATYGQERLPVTITMAILPDGTAIQWKSGQAGDAAGATGIPAKVNNHYGSVILGAGLSALLNIGTRAPFGSTANFQQNLPQEFAQDTAQSLGQSAQGMVNRALSVSPNPDRQVCHAGHVAVRGKCELPDEAHSRHQIERIVHEAHASSPC